MITTSDSLGSLSLAATVAVRTFPKGVILVGGRVTLLMVSSVAALAGYSFVGQPGTSPSGIQRTIIARVGARYVARVLQSFG